VIIGVMRQRVTIQSPQEVRSPSGETTLQWVDVATVFAQVEGLSSRDIMQAQQANVLATHKIRIRYRDGVTHLHRIKWRGRIMELASVTERDKRTYLEMMAREVQ
jgi:SPP1 family predicted phage head-tail adaptor